MARVNQPLDRLEPAAYNPPLFPAAHRGLGNALAGLNQWPAAVEQYTSALAQDPRYTDAYYDWNNLTNTLFQSGKYEAAAEQFQAALKLKDDSEGVHFNLGVTWMRLKRFDAACEQFTAALRLKPDYGEAHFMLGQALCAQRKFTEALGQYRAAVALRPKSAEILRELAWLLATCPDPNLRRGAEAVTVAREACELDGNAHPEPLDSLAAAYAEQGDYATAVATGQKALDRARAVQRLDLTGALEHRLALYQKNQPFHEE